MDHIAYLSQEIGARPSGTEEEQQAALYITDRLQKDAHLSANIEDFACSNNPGLAKVICHAIAIVAVLLSIVLPITAIPSAVVALLAAAVLFLETFDKPVISQLFMKGISQNVVGKYEPVRDPDSAGARRRKVILVAHYDSGKLRRDLARPLVAIRRVLDIAVLAASVLIPVFILITAIAFSNVQGAGAIAIIVIKTILAVIVLIPVVFYIMEKVSDYNEAANSNAAGVAVMLEVARRLGTGEVSSSPIASGVMHDEHAAREAGVVPEGATISYESDASDGLSAAKAAVAAMTGGAVHHGVRDIADNLVQVKDAPISAPDDAAVSKARQETRTALTSAPAGTLAEAAAKAAALHEQAEQRAAEEAAAIERAAQEAAAREAEEQRAAEEAEAARAAAATEASKPATVPDWYKKATEKARIKAEQSGEHEEAAQYRSRYADFPSDSQESSPAEEPEAHIERAHDAQLHPSNMESSQVEGDVSRETTTDAAVTAQAAAVSAPADSVAAANDAPAPMAAANAGATTAMPALSQQGKLDLGALRAAAQAGVLTSDEQTQQAQQPQQAASEEVPPAISGAATTRLPQMMYYTPPADRSDVMRDRAQKNRVTVSAEGIEQAATMDAAEASSPTGFEQVPIPAQVDAAYETPLAADQMAAPAEQSSPINQAAPQSGAAVAAPAADQGRVLKANIPVVDLPQITLPPISAPELKPVSFEEFRQRAPLANVADAHGQDAAKSLLATTLPSIEDPDADATVGMPAVQDKPQSVSLTGSFAAVEAIGSKPVGDELVNGLDPEDIYVDDADDSSFDAEFTETGAFAGPGYVEMPQSRIGKFFGKFRRKNKKDEESTHDWLGVDENFDARSVGKARGGWESFRDEEDDWNGGAFSSIRARMGRGGDPADESVHDAQPREESRRTMEAGPSVSADEFAAVAAMAASKAAKDEGVAPVPHADFDDMQQIYSFASGDINTEVWFVALGSELAEQGGIKAFLADHASDMRGALIINLESLGAGDLCYLEREGSFKQMGCSPRMKRFIRKATQASGVDLGGATVDWRESPASYAMKHRAQAVTIAGMDGNKPALMGEADDVIENIDEQSLTRAADFVVEMLKNI